MTAKNDITGDLIASRKTSDAYRDNFDRIFGNKRHQKEKVELCAPFPGMNEPWSEEKIAELDEVLSKYEAEGECTKCKNSGLVEGLDTAQNKVISS